MTNNSFALKYYALVITLFSERHPGKTAILRSNSARPFVL